MARISGTIESLKSLKAELDYKGISRFSSVKDINNFLSNYNSEKLAILKEASDALEKEYFDTCINLEQRIHKKAEIVNLEKERIDTRIVELQAKIDLIHNKNSENIFKKLLSKIHLFSLKKQFQDVVANKTELISLSVKEISEKIKNDDFFINKYETEKQNLIEKKAKSRTEKLEYTRQVLENSKNLIAGAIGENLVVKEIKKLSDDYVLINDFNLNFSRPIFYKKYNERISSIQIDHLLISKAGIFIIETKNWSRSAVDSLSLRSPIEQIERANFALYVYISKNITLKEHHWGEQQIPIRNLIVMINNKPKGKFKYVKIKLLNEMNDYIKYFDPVLTENQINKIIDQLV